MLFCNLALACLVVSIRAKESKVAIQILFEFVVENDAPWRSSVRSILESFLLVEEPGKDRRRALLRGAFAIRGKNGLVSRVLDVHS